MTEKIKTNCYCEECSKDLIDGEDNIFIAGFDCIGREQNVCEDCFFTIFNNTILGHK